MDKSNDEGIASVTMEVIASLSEHHQHHLHAMESHFTRRR